MDHFVQPSKRPCLHTRANADPRCKDCGKVTRSHVLEGTVTDAVECPDCGKTVSVPRAAVQCHTCFEKAKTPEEL